MATNSAERGATLRRDVTRHELAQLLEHARDGTLLLNDDNKLLFANAVAKQLLSNTKLRLGENGILLWPSSQRDSVVEALRFARQAPGSSQSLCRVHGKTGMLQVRVVAIAKGHVALYIVTDPLPQSDASDVADSGASAKAFATLAERSSGLLALLDSSARILEVNSQFLSVASAAHEEVKKMGLQRLFTNAEYRVEIAPRVAGALTGTGSYTARWFNLGGAPRFIDFRFDPVFDGSGAVQAVVVAGMDVTELRLGQEELEQALQALSDRNAELQQLAYITSHDLREPLNTLGSYAELLQEALSQQGLEEPGLTFLRYMMGATGRLKELVAALLDFARLETSRSNEMGSVDLQALLTEVVDDLGDLRKASGGTVEFRGLPTVTGDQTLLRQLFQNLLVNSLKYARPGVPPVVRVRVRDAGRVFWADVEDNGIGIEAQHLDTIFGIFRRLHTQEEYSGTGLGLALCRKIVHLHGGRITATSVVGERSTFHFTLPKNPRS